MGLVIIALMNSLCASVALALQSVQAFCLFNCEAEDLKNRLQANADCYQNQISMMLYGRTDYDTEDLDSTGKIITIDGVQYTEDELRQEWKDNPESHSSNCYFIADITPQEVEKVYRESIGQK